ncbi:MAG: hypothetical protein LH481_15575 [Burkholderiales bacterium]|nr:hypothetical protein [Burkholderiales bacterium]
MDAFAVEVPTNALNGLERNPNVEYVEEDAKRYPYSGTTPSTGSPYFAGQLVPYGIKMVQRLINYQMAMGLPATGRFALSIPAMTCSTKI